MKKQKKINIKSENIFTAFRHYENDLFKVWVSINNKKLISCIHGGNIEKEFFSIVGKDIVTIILPGIKIR